MVFGGFFFRGTVFSGTRRADCRTTGSRFYWPEDVRDSENTVLQIRDGTLQGKPSLSELGWTNFVPNGGTLFFSPVSAATGPEAMKQYTAVRKRFDEFGFDYLGDFAIGMREIHHIVIVVFDRSDREEKARALKMLKLLVRDCAELGFGEYRTHLSLMDDVSDTYCWGESQAHGGSIMRFNELLKDAIDPNGILAPGKSGIWPRQYREDGAARAGKFDKPVTAPKI
jgi:hypothetical protein